MKELRKFVKSVKDVVDAKAPEERKEKLKNAQTEFLDGLDTVSKNIEKRGKELKESFDTKRATGHGFNVRDFLNKKSDK